MNKSALREDVRKHFSDFRYLSSTTEPNILREFVRYEEVPIYDENGNYVKTITNVYVTMEKVMGFRMFKRKAKLKDENYKIPKLKKLFETSADKKDNEEKTNNELLEIC